MSTLIKQTKARVLVMSGQGLNCEIETLSAFQMVGIEGDIRHVDDILADKSILAGYQVLVIPGGFSFGDYTGAGKALANRLRDEFTEPFRRFMERDNTLVLGICNGCQALLKSRLWTLNDGLSQSITLTMNVGGHYRCRWVEVSPTEQGRQSAWLSRVGAVFQLPIAHGEGRFILGEAEQTVALKYEGENPNGSDHQAAAVMGYDGRVLVMMPHPERAVRFTQQPEWTAMRETLRRTGVDLPPFGPGYAIFESAAAFFR